MAYRSLTQCVLDLEHRGHLVRIPDLLDPHLEMAEVQRRVYRSAGPALLFERVEGSPFPAVSNLFGTVERCRFIFRDTLERVQKVVRMRADPTEILRSPMAALFGTKALPREVGSGPVLAETAQLGELPAIVSWPDDGGPFITLGQVYSEDPDDPGPMRSNLGIYRVQLGGNEYGPGEVGMHYQIHRGIGVHHAAAVRRGEPLRVSVFVGGPPAHTVAAVMPLPEGLSELSFAGMLAGRRFRYVRRNGYVVSADADFCICGTVDPTRTLPEGPFGDHLGYYSLRHDFPVLEVEAIYRRADPIWPFTVVGRPPQEDTTFGKMVHELTAPMVPRSIAGLHALHAVDAAGVHPLMLAIGSERYVPYQGREPKELLTIANAVLGFGQASLAKYLMIVAREDEPELDIHEIPAFLAHVLERADWRRDLHFHTRTTIDTLDYSGTGLNAGSKVVMAVAGEPRRSLARSVPADLSVPDGFGDMGLAVPGVLVIQGPAVRDPGEGERDIAALTTALAADPRACDPKCELPLVVVVDDAGFTIETLANFLWVTFTRSNPSHDIHGVGSFIEHKHWGCRGALVIDARRKPHHAPPLIEDAAVSRRVDALAKKGGPLHGII